MLMGRDVGNRDHSGEIKIEHVFSITIKPLGKQKREKMFLAQILHQDSS